MDDDDDITAEWGYWKSIQSKFTTQFGGRNLPPQKGPKVLGLEYFASCFLWERREGLNTWGFEQKDKDMNEDPFPLRIRGTRSSSVVCCPLFSPD